MMKYLSSDQHLDPGSPQAFGPLSCLRSRVVGLAAPDLATQARIVVDDSHPHAAHRGTAGRA